MSLLNDDLGMLAPLALPKRAIDAVAATAACPAIVVCTASSATDLSGTPLAAAELIVKPFSDGDLLAACQRARARSVT